MLDKKYNFLEKEKKWQDYWQEKQIFKFDKNSKKPVYAIDTPPPTVNGKIHIGHIFSYTQTEMIARYKRLRGYNIFYPFGLYLCIFTHYILRKGYINTTKTVLLYTRIYGR